MKIKNAEMLKVAVKKEQYPKEGPIEIALAGRSNVGKSSLINTLVNRKKLARTSSQPGKTQTINFYSINNDEFRLVDLPGYGYARVSMKEREKWGKMIENFLTSRRTLAEVILLLDIRHSPGEHDKMMYNWIKSFGYNGIIIATKADKISKGKWMKHKSIIAKALGVQNRELIIPFSATKRLNKEKVLNLIEEIIKVNTV
ncbi:ribosome biogenesis GTP-binding protein YihA/YsxC [Thermohalobacter berrensis]|uniref:Probable GTP-binding protein EngB n=1 Tax=Thermohalobacter berrensis TaxID=99594 RepID=A0A419SUS0_9FIRM|nr:ribosome biogenesis GTP-binding protein YihA/YsxC [Thermohalobacter berrensis]RKD28968.1 YihA family ribosome biogenesis GTP-binding protein [Thermohalobacter berrensis]